MTKRSQVGNLTNLGAAKGRDRYRWRLRYRGHSAQFVGTQAEAKRELRSWAVEIDAGKIKRSTTTVLDLLNEYLDGLDGATTAHTMRRNARLHLAPLHDIPATKLTPRQIDNLYRDLLATLAPITIGRVHAVLNAALQRAWRLGAIAENPAAKAAPPPIKQRRRPDIDTTTVLGLLNVPGDPLLEAFARVAAATGCRAGELCGLQWSAVDLDAGRATIRQSVAYLGSAGVIVKGTKTGRDRVVTLDAVAQTTLRSWRRRQVETALARGVPLGPWVFTPDESASAPWVPQRVSSRWGRHCRRQGATVRLHDLRHWFASASLRSGMDPMLTARQLGHSSPAMTLSVYSHVVDRAPTVSTLADAMAAAKG